MLIKTGKDERKGLFYWIVKLQSVSQERLSADVLIGPSCYRALIQDQFNLLETHFKL